MTNKIKIGTVEHKDLTIDIDKFIETRGVIQGVSGTGKSGLIRVICEQASKYVPVIVLDREGEFATLREKVDLILVGDKGDIPTDLRAVEILARKLVELRVSAVIDLYDLGNITRQREYVRRFCDALLNLPKTLYTPLLIVIDEAHLFVPERGQRGKDIVSTEAVLDLIAQGRKRGFSTLLATQRFSKVHNDALSELRNVFIGSTWLDADQKTAGEYLGLTGNDRRQLREMEKRTFFCFGPALSIAGVSKMHVADAETTFPKAGQIQNLKLPKASEAISDILGQLDDLPEVAEAEKRDVASLRTENADLKRQLAERPTVPEPVEVEKLVEVPVLPADFAKHGIELGDTVSKKIATFVDDLAVHVGEFEAIADKIRSAVETATGEKVAVSHQASAISNVPRSNAPVRPAELPAALREKAFERVGVDVRPQPERAVKTAIEPGDLTSLHRSLLNGIALLHNLGIEWPSRLQVGAVIGKSHTAGPIRGAFNKLQDHGYIDVSGEGVRLTHTGRVEAVALPINSRAEIHEMWFSRLNTLEENVLRVLVSEYPHSVDRETIGTTIGKSHTAGPVRGAFNSLKAKGLVDELEGETLVASHILFPEGLR